MHTLLTTITDLGDTAILIPMTLAVSVYFALAGWKQAAAVFLGGFMAISLLIGALKLLLIGCGPVTPWFHIRSPSGHAALSTVVYGLLAHVVAMHLHPRWSRPVALATAMLILAIGLSRVLLGYHSWQEVVVGGVLGLGILAVCRHCLPGETMAPVRLGGLAAVCLALVLALNGVHLPVEAAIRQYASLLRMGAPVCLAESIAAEKLRRVSSNNTKYLKSHLSRAGRNSSEVAGVPSEVTR